jgi:AAA domain/CHC2 zinc finger
VAKRIVVGGSYELAWYLERLEEVRAVRDGVEYWAICPCHDDTSPSLHLTQSDKLLAHCFSCGVSLPDVRDSLEGRSNGHVNGGATTARRQSARAKASHVGALDEYARDKGIQRGTLEALGVTEALGGVAFTFGVPNVAKVRHPAGAEHKFTWEGDGARPDIWPTPEDDLPAEIHITAGETDCLTLRSLGLVAFTATKGERTGLDPWHYEGFRARGVERVVIYGDADATGQAAARAEAQKAKGAALEVAICNPRQAIDPFSGLKDINDLYKASESADDFLATLDACTRTLTSARATLSVRESFEQPDEDEDEIVRHLLAAGDKFGIVGEQKSLKTYQMLDLSRALVRCEPVFGVPEWTPTRASRVAIFEEEGRKRKLLDRLRLVFGYYDEATDENLLVRFRHGVTFTDEGWVAEIADVLQRERIDVAFFDPFQRMTPGIDENSARDQRIVWDNINRISAECPTTALGLVHHANKDKRNGLSWNSIRGSSVFGGEVDWAMIVEKVPETQTTGTIQAFLDGREIPATAKGELFEIAYTIDPPDTFKLDGCGFVAKVRERSMSAAEKTVRDYFAKQRDWVRKRDVREATSVSDRSLDTYLRKLLNEGVIEAQDKVPGKTALYRGSANA